MKICDQIKRKKSRSIKSFQYYHQVSKQSVNHENSNYLLDHGALSTVPVPALAHDGARIRHRELSIEVSRGMNLLPHVHDSADTNAGMHIMETIIDLVQRTIGSNEVVEEVVALIDILWR